MSYSLFWRSLSDPCGFISGNPFEEKGAMIPDQYELKLMLIRLKIHKALLYKGDRQPYEGLKIVKSTHFGFPALYDMNRLLHPFMVRNPTTLSPDLPKHGDTETFDSCERQTSFHRVNTTLLNNIVLDLGEVITQNAYIDKLRNYENIINIAVRE